MVNKTRGGSASRRGRGRGRGAGNKGRFKDLSASVSSLSLQDRPESAVDEIEGGQDHISEGEATSSESGLFLAYIGATYS
jgi:pre-rRNA-processing protein TSR3